jgi:hypothetical protein
MADKYEFSADEERLQRESQRKANADAARAASAATPAGQAYAARKAARATAFGAAQAQKARDIAAKSMRNSRSMPDNFPVPQYGEQDE